MAWPAIIGAVASLAGGMMSARGAEKGQEAQGALTKEVALLQANEGRKTTAFEADLADYYSQLNKQRRRDARGSTWDKYSKIAKPEGFLRAPLVGEKPKPPESKLPTEAKPKKKKRSLLDRLTKPSLSPSGLLSGDFDATPWN
jgi:hypothetical protein